jgi:hypothetical protein
MDSFTLLLMKKRLEMLTLLITALGAIVLGAMALYWSKGVATWTQALYITVIVCAIVNLVSRDYLLPFLGDAVFPCDSMATKVPENANMQTKIQTKPNSNVVYWAADAHKEIMSNPWTAYADYANAGVVRSDINGIAILHFRKPTGYKVAQGLMTLKPHVHYRVCENPGMLSKIKTVYV